MAGQVMHCSAGLRGYLVGVAFDEPTLPDKGTGPAAANPLEVQAEESPVAAGRSAGGGASQRSAQSAMSLAIVLSSLASALTVVVVVQGRLFDVEPFVLALGAVGISGLLAIVCTWKISRSREMYVRMVHGAVRRLATNPTDVPALPRAPHNELARLRRAVMELQQGLQRHEYSERLQREMLQDLSKVKSNILAIVSHDLRTPLTSILLYTRMLISDRDSLTGDEQANFLNIIADECNRLSRLVNDLLEVQRMESDEVRWNMKNQDLASSIRDCARVFEALAASKSMTLTVTCPDSLPAIDADSDKITQALSNLVSNALKYTPTGGCIEVSSEVQGNDLIIRVADDGPGIPRDKWDQIFDRFSQLGDPDTSEVAGVGLGLHIVKKIVEAHGGVVWVDSEPGKGSQFYISLPIKSEAEEPDLDAEQPAIPQRVVVCDPDPELAATIGKALRSRNYRVRTVHSGKRLLAILDQGELDVVITDIAMPDMGAAELLQGLGDARNRSFALIVHSFEGDACDLKKHGVHVFLRRPVSRNDLLQAVQDAGKARICSGLVTLIVKNEAFDADRMHVVLSKMGNTTIELDDLAQALEMLRDGREYQLVISERALSKGWSELAAIRDDVEASATIVVLCDAIRRRERRLEESLDVVALACQPGVEESVLEALSRPKYLEPMESVA